MFAAAWGAFPVLTAYYAQHERLDIAAVAAGVFCFLLSRAQRELSTPARALRRKTTDVTGTIVRADGSIDEIDQQTLLAPLEGALRALSWAAVSLAVDPRTRPARTLAVTRSVAVIGGGPAGLMAAETLARAGVAVTVYEHMPSIGRKLLLAGRAGLTSRTANPSTSWSPDTECAADRLEAAIRAFTPRDCTCLVRIAGRDRPLSGPPAGCSPPRSAPLHCCVRGWLAWPSWA